MDEDVRQAGKPEPDLGNLWQVLVQIETNTAVVRAWVRFLGVLVVLVLLLWSVVTFVGLQSATIELERIRGEVNVK